MENPIKMDDLVGNTTIFGNTHIYIYLYARIDQLPLTCMMGDGHTPTSFHTKWAQKPAIKGMN